MPAWSAACDVADTDACSPTPPKSDAAHVAIMWHHKEGIFIQIVSSEYLLKHCVYNVREDNVLEISENMQRCLLYHFVFSLCYKTA